MRLSASCRDKGRGGVDEGALCLSWSECDHLASRNPNASKSEEDKHKAPTLPHIRPLSLQDGDTRIPEFGREKPSGRGRTIPFFGYQTFIRQGISPARMERHSASLVA